MRAKFLKRICSAILAVAMLMSLAPITTFAITDEDIPASVELGKGFNLLDCKTFESANLKSAILFDNVDTLNPTKVRVADVESNMTYITSMSSYLDNTHTDVSAEVGVTKEGLIAKAEIKAKFGFKGEWESSGTVNTSRLILEILGKAYKYSLNMEMSEPWAKGDDGKYLSINPTFAYDLVHMRPEELFGTYGTHIVTQYDAGGEAYTSYEGTDASNSMKSEFDITANAEVKVDAKDVAEVNVAVNTSGGEKHEESFANNNKQTSMRVRGGDPFYSTFDKIISGDADDTVNNWLQSMFTMDENTDSTKATMIKTDDLKLMPVWELLEMDYGTDHSARVAQLRDYFQENANREYLELYEEFIYGIPGDYADNYNVVQKAFVSEENLDAVESVPADRIPIYTEAELNKIGKSAEYPLDGNYILMRDIELKYDFGGIGYTSDRTIEPFTGDFDGNGHTIYDLNPVVRYNGTTEVYMGFILYNKGKVYNLRFLDSNDDCREAEKTTASIKSGVANSATAYLGLVVGRNEAEENTSNIYNIYVDNATFIIKNTPATTYCGLVAGHLGESFVTDVTVVNSHLDVAGTVTTGAYCVGGVSGYAVNGGGMISHNNFVRCDKDSLVGGCIGHYDSTNETRKDTYAYENDVQSTSTPNRQLAGSDNLNAYTFGGADKYALANEKVFKYYCDNDELVGGLGGYAEEWKEHSETESKPWLIVHASDGMTAYQNSLISMKNLKVYFAQYGDDTSVYEDVTDRVNFVYDFSEIAEDVPVTVVYGKHLVEFTVDVVEPVVTDIAITNKGKTQFRVGEKFDNSLFAGQVLYSNNLTDSLGATDEGLKVYIPELEGDNPINVGEYKFIETLTGTDVVVEYKDYRATYQISVLPEDLKDKLHFSTESVESAPGGEFDVAIELVNNPGIVALSAYIEYDNDLFEVVSVKDAGLLKEFNGFNDSKPSVPLLWMELDPEAVDNTESGTLVTVRFKVKEGDYDESVYGMHLFKCVNGEAFNKAGKSIMIPDLPIKVRLNKTTIGDVNSDTIVNSWDAVLLAQHTFDIPNGINTAAADINRDTIVDDIDSTNLNRHLVGFFGIDGTPGIFDVRVKSEFFDDTILEGLVVNSIIPQPEEKLGYIFQGYYSDAEYQIKLVKLPPKMVKEMVIYAKYERGYVIESDLELTNDIHVPGHETQLIHKVDEDTEITMWNVYDGDRLVFVQTSSIPADYTPTKGLYVEKFVEDLTGRTYSITYVENGVECTYTTENPTTYTYGVDTVLSSPESTLNNTAIKFKGWYDNPEFNGRPVTNMNGRAGDTTLYAKWEYYTCRVNLDPRGGILDKTVLTHTYGTETVLPIPTHPNPGYKFVRWLWNDRGSLRHKEKIPAVPDYMYDGFYYEIHAEWVYEPTITLTLRGSATNPDSTEIEIRENVDAFTQKYSIAVPSTSFVKSENDGEMYRFMGWYSTTTGAPVTEQYLENVEYDLDLTAKWEWQDPNIYVSFCDTDGTLIEKSKISYDEDLAMAEVIEAPEKDGFVLAGWTTVPFNGKTGYLPYYPFYVPLDGVQDGQKNYKFYAYWLPETEAKQYTYSFNGEYYRKEFPEKTIVDTYVPVVLCNSNGDITTVPYAELYIPKSVEKFEKAFFIDVSDPSVIGFNFNFTSVKGAQGLAFVIEDSANIKTLVRFFYSISSTGKGGCLFGGSSTYYVYTQSEPFHTGWSNSIKCNSGTAISAEEFATKFAAPTREGYTFEGWYDNFEYTGDPITEIPATHRGDIVLFAKWVENTTATE